ncbi:hypothetical protein ACFL35_09115 [Candidatus Riflebacteria bacterium]
MTIHPYYKTTLAFLFLSLFIFTGCGRRKTDTGKNGVIVPVAIDDNGETINMDARQKLLHSLKLSQKYFEYSRAKTTYINEILALSTKKEGLTAEKRKQLKALVQNYRLSSKKYHKFLRKLNTFEGKRQAICMKSLKKIIKLIKKIEKKRRSKVRKLKLKVWKKKYSSFKNYKGCPENGNAELWFNRGKRYMACSVHGLYGKPGKIK